MKYRTLIFDWSGTLVDDLPPTLHATNAVLQSHGVAAMGRDEFRQRFRLPYPEFYEEMLPGVSISGLEDLFRSSFHGSPVAVSVLPHAREMLAWCREQEIRCFVLSSMDSGLFEGQARNFELDGFFEHTYSAVIDKREKIGGILSSHDLDPQTTAFVGDMVHDIETAKHGGVDSIALGTGYDPVERLRAAEPTHYFEDLELVRKWLEKLSSTSPLS